MEAKLVRHGRFDIKAGQMKNEFVAYAYVARPKAVSGIYAEARGESEEDVIFKLTLMLDKQAKRRLEARRRDNHTDFLVPTEDEYRDALKAVLPTLCRSQQDMFSEHAKSGDQGLTAGELARAGGYPNYETANSMYGRVGRAFQDYLGIAAPAAVTKDGDVATGIIATSGDRRSNGNFVWIMHQELRDAYSPTTETKEDKNG